MLRGGEPKDLSPAVRMLGRVGTRAVGVASAPVRPLPDFLIIGAKRAGTTSLYRYLLSHPAVLPMFPSSRRLPLRADRKGVHYFDLRWGLPPGWYRSHFPSAPYRRAVSALRNERAITGEATPYYLFHPHAARRARSVLPDVKLLVLLRNPIDRALSHYNEQRRGGLEPLSSFDEAVAAEPQRLAGQAERLRDDPHALSFEHEHQSYVQQGFYLASLDPWFACYPEEQFHIVSSEEFYRDPQQVFDGVVRFLDLRTHRLDDTRTWNSAKGQRLDPALREELGACYAPANRALEARLGRRFGWDEA